MPTTYLYRVNGGQVLGASIDADAYAGVDPAFFATVAGPPTPDGLDLAVPKIYDGLAVRNATPEEIEGFAVAEAEDAASKARAQAEALLSGGEPIAIAVRALAYEIQETLSELRSKNGMPARDRQTSLASIAGRIRSGEAG